MAAAASSPRPSSDWGTERRGKPQASRTSSGWVNEKRGKPQSMSLEEELARLRIILENEAKSTSRIIMYNEGDATTTDYPTADERDKIVSWFYTLTNDLHFSISVFYQSTLLLDTFLSTRKLRRELLKTTAASCYSIATQLVESSDSVAALSHKLSNIYYVECSRSQIQKMEAYLLHTPEFPMTRNVYTIQDYIKKFHSIALHSQMFILPPHVSIAVHLSHLYKCAQHVVCDHHLMKYKPSLLALAVLGCDLKLLRCNWLSTLLYLEVLLQVKGGELSICYEAVAADFPEIYANYPLPSPHAPPKPPRQKWLETPHSTHHEENKSEETDEGKERERKPLRRKGRRKYRPPLSRTINMAIV